MVYPGLQSHGMYRKFNVFRYAMNIPLPPLKRGIGEVPSWERIEEWGKSRWILSFKAQAIASNR